MTRDSKSSGDVRVRVADEQAGATLAAIVRSALDGLPWSKSRGLIETGRVSVDGEQWFDPAARVEAGASVDIRPTAPRRTVPILPERRIIHLDHEVIVVDKPAGLISVPHDDDDRDSLLARTREAIRSRGERAHGGDKQQGLGVVQRLDKDTTGLMLFARTRRARKHLENQFRARTITRRYLALANGSVRAATHESYLVANRGDGLRGSWRQGGGKPPKHARRAVTHVKIEEALRGATLVACTLETGRQHQIRIHLAEAGNPLVGETVYMRGHGRPAVTADRPMLHAATLGFVHPGHERRLMFESELPEDFVAALERLRTLR